MGSSFLAEQLKIAGPIPNNIKIGFILDYLYSFSPLV